MAFAWERENMKNDGIFLCLLKFIYEI